MSPDQVKCPGEGGGKALLGENNDSKVQRKKGSVINFRPCQVVSLVKWFHVYAWKNFKSNFDNRTEMDSFQIVE